jgi:hypothetical protein
MVMFLHLDSNLWQFESPCITYIYIKRKTAFFRSASQQDGRWNYSIRVTKPRQKRSPSRYNPSTVPKSPKDRC